jgi:hypothetical protein
VIGHFVSARAGRWETGTGMKNYDISDEMIDAALEAFYAPSGERPWHPLAVKGMRRALAAAKVLLVNGEYPLVRFCRCPECQSNPQPGKMTAHDVVLHRGAGG